MKKKLSTRAAPVKVNAPPPKRRDSKTELDAGAKLLQEHYSGNDASFEQFVLSHGTWMKRSIRRLASVVDVEDVVQSVLMRIYAQRPDASREPRLHGSSRRTRSNSETREHKTPYLYDPAKGSVEAWLYTLVMSNALHELRKSKRLDPYDETSDLRVVQADGEFIAELHELIESLQPLERDVILGRIEGRTYQEIAEALAGERSRVGPPVLLPNERSRLKTSEIYDAVRRVKKRLE